MQGIVDIIISDESASRGLRGPGCRRFIAAIHVRDEVVGWLHDLQEAQLIGGRAAAVFAARQPPSAGRNYPTSLVFCLHAGPNSGAGDQDPRRTLMDDRSQNQANRRRIALLGGLGAVAVAAVLAAAVTVSGVGHQTAGGITAAAPPTQNGSSATGTGGGAAQQGGEANLGGGNAGSAANSGAQGGQGDPKNPGPPKNPGNPKNPGGPKPPWWENPSNPIIIGGQLIPVPPEPQPPPAPKQPPPGKDKAKV
jgi:hypothetical protein